MQRQYNRPHRIEVTSKRADVLSGFRHSLSSPTFGQQRTCRVQAHVQANVHVKDAIFLHSGWRAASTYVWAKFRQRSDTYCYFEPLNEHLFTLTPEVVDGFVPWSFANHPPLEAPYLEEFRPLIAKNGTGSGVPRFPAHLTFGRYCATGNDSLPELENYLADLAGLAARRGRRPVYGFVRTDMRVAWFRAHMAGTHIFIRREPRCQFLSMLRQAVQGNPYFLQRGLAILRHNIDSPAFAPLLAAIDLTALPDSPGLRDAFRNKRVGEKLLRSLYFIFYFMWRVARQVGEPQCHLTIDIDCLSQDDSYRRDIESRLGDQVGMAISFSDCRVERYDDSLSWAARQFEALEREIESLANTACAELSAQLK
jgi:hypothetical protein